MFSSTHLVHDRLGDHHDPKHLTEEDSRSPVLMWVESAGREGEMEASHVYRHSEPGLERHL